MIVICLVVQKTVGIYIDNLLYDILEGYNTGTLPLNRQIYFYMVSTLNNLRSRQWISNLIFCLNVSGKFTQDIIKL